MPKVPRFDVRARTGDDEVEHVEVNGELDIATVPVLEEAVLELRDKGRAVMLDLRGLTFMDSTGLRTLLELAGHGSTGDWKLLMLRPQGDAARVLELTDSADRLPFVD